MSLDANDLILFARIMEAGSFSRAAERTGLPKSTLSRRITLLETKLGERLLKRSTRRLAITEFGERILDHAKRLLDETEAATAMALHQQEIPRGILRVSLPPDFVERGLGCNGTAKAVKLMSLLIRQKMAVQPDIFAIHDSLLMVQSSNDC
ncbi:LysR family transcriptional regulator [Propionivibrio sp.]|uniref:LysR family transcriptional regulator n=1 Tax=Propionivibrio sp. TaxID=2212460 RepID=UPI003BF2EE01